MIFFFLKKENMSWLEYKNKILNFFGIDEFPFHIYYEIDNSKLLEEICLDKDVNSIVLRRPITYMCDKLYILPEYDLKNLSLMKNYICMIEYSNYEKLISRDDGQFWTKKENKFLAFIIVKEDSFKVVPSDLEALTKKFGRSSSTKNYLEENTKFYKNLICKFYLNDSIVYSRQKETVEFLNNYKKTDIPYEFNIDVESIVLPPEKWKLNEDTFEIDLENISDSEEEISEESKENKPNFEPFQIKTEYTRGDSYTDEEYNKYLYNYLYELFKIIVPESKKALIPYIVNKKTIEDHWRCAFTHKSKDPNEGKNYETYEKLGDKLLSYCFNTYLFERNPLINESTINDLSQKYDSAQFQSQVTTELGLDNFLLDGGTDLTMKLKEDLYESFCGCLDVVLKEQSIGYGAIIVYNIIKIIFKDFDFNNVRENEEGLTINKNYINGKSFIEQLFGRLGYTSNSYVPITRPKHIDRTDWYEILEDINKVSLDKFTLKFGPKDELKESYGFIESQNFNEEKGLWTTNIYLTKEGLEVFKKLNAPGVDKIPNNLLIGKHVSKDKKDFRGYEKAKDFLEDKVGITTDFMLKHRKSTKFEGDSGIKNLDQAKEKAKMEMPNFEKFDKKFETWTGTKDKLVQLIGIDTSGYKKILYSKRFPNTDRKAIQTIIDMYISS